MTSKALTPARRQRLLATLFVGAGLNRTAIIAAITVTALAGEELLGSARWSGLPVALITIGTAVGVSPMSAFMARTGRRPGLVLGLAIGATGALIAVAALELGAFGVLAVGTFVFGLANSADLLSRYAAADVSEERHAGRAIALIVWAGTIGSIAGPAMLGPSEQVASAIGLPGLAGAYLVAALCLVVSAAGYFAFLRPEPLHFAPKETARTDQQRMSLADAVRTPNVWFALVALVVGQVVMVLIMTMTPVHIRRAGEGLGIVGLVISAHTLGMFGLSPVTGMLADRLGRVRVVMVGQGMLVVAAASATFAAGDDRILLVGSLFLLGLGWNFGFVAGSALVTEGLVGQTRLRVQGTVDAVVWMSSAAASLTSGLVLDWGGYPRLALAAGSLVAVTAAARAGFARQTAEAVG